MIDYIVYVFAVIGVLITLKYFVIPFLYLSLCAIGYTRFRRAAVIRVCGGGLV